MDICSNTVEERSTVPVEGIRREAIIERLVRKTPLVRHPVSSHEG